MGQDQQGPWPDTGMTVTGLETSAPTTQGLKAARSRVGRGQK